MLCSMFIVRHVRPDDRAAWHGMRGELWPDDAREHEREIDAFFAGRLRDPAAVLIAGNAQGDTLGFAELSIRPYAEGCETDRVAFLEGWYVVPPARGMGVGRALLDAAEAWARSRGCTELGSDALLDNEIGRAAHRALGFEEIEQVRCFLKRLDRTLSPAPPMAPVTTGPVLVRHAILADADALADLVTQLGYPASPEAMRTRLAHILPRHDYVTLMGIVDEAVAGFIGVTVRPSYTADELQGQIIALAVASSFRRRGVGRALVEAAEALLSERGATAVVVTIANRRSDAHAFYERLGYVFTGRRYRKNTK
jgi:aminoglycoside 6'-N-acetyltransferase I